MLVYSSGKFRSLEHQWTPKYLYESSLRTGKINVLNTEGFASVSLAYPFDKRAFTQVLQVRWQLTLGFFFLGECPPEGHLILFRGVRSAGTPNLTNRLRNSPFLKRARAQTHACFSKAVLPILNGELENSPLILHENTCTRTSRCGHDEGIFWWINTKRIHGFPLQWFKCDWRYVLNVWCIIPLSKYI